MASVFIFITLIFSSLAHAKTVSENQEKTVNETQFIKSEFYRFRPSTKSSWLSLEYYKQSQWVYQLSANSSESIFGLKLDSPFLFYGHEVIEVQISKKGFIHMDQVKTDSHDSPYISPLYTKYQDHYPTSSVYYFKNDKMLIVWWMNLKHQTYPIELSFQVIYKAGGEIVFNYKNKMHEDEVKSLEDSHSVIGLSDALYKNHQDAKVEPYHVLHLPLRILLKYQRIVFTPLPNCVGQETCEDCTSMNRFLTYPNHHIKKFCYWCPTLNMCSDGSDKLAHHWQANQCYLHGFKEVEFCFKQENPHALEKHMLRLKNEEEEHEMEIKMKNQQEHMRKSNVVKTLEKDFLSGRIYDVSDKDDNYDYYYDYGDQLITNFSTPSMGLNETSNSSASIDVNSGEILKEKNVLAMIDGLTTLLTFIFQFLLFIFIIFLCLINTSFIIYLLEAYFPNFKFAAYLKKKLFFVGKLCRNREMRSFRTLSESSEGNHTVEMREINEPNDPQNQITDISPPSTMPSQKMVAKTDVPPKIPSPRTN